MWHAYNALGACFFKNDFHGQNTARGARFFTWFWYVPDFDPNESGTPDFGNIVTAFTVMLYTITGDHK